MSTFTVRLRKGECLADWIDVHVEADDNNHALERALAVLRDMRRALMTTEDPWTVRAIAA